MKIAKVYDNGSQTFDRYTITFKDSSDALGLSENCDSPRVLVSSELLLMDGI